MAATSPMKVIAACLIVGIGLQMCHGSAIPIWEFLTRNEKMSYLYSTFAQLVSVHCKATAASSSLPVNQCKRNLLTYGNEKLQSFTEAQLDALDPYQRGANELIWSSIMRDHPSSVLITTRKPLPTPPASSIIILTHQTPVRDGSVSTPSSSSAADAAVFPSKNSEEETDSYAQNPIFEANGEPTRDYAMDMDIAYGLPSMTLQPPPAQVETFEISPQGEILPPVQELLPPKTYLTGPLVFRVRPDGSPVDVDDYSPLPKDDDVFEVYQVSAGSSNSGESQATTATNGRVKHHRRIATISALKQQQQQQQLQQQQLPQQQAAQQFEFISPLQRELQPPYEQPRIRRHFQFISRAVPVPAVNGFMAYANKAQA